MPRSELPSRLPSGPASPILLHGPVLLAGCAITYAQPAQRGHRLYLLLGSVGPSAPARLALPLDKPKYLLATRRTGLAIRFVPLAHGLKSTSNPFPELINQVPARKLPDLPLFPLPVTFMAKLGSIFL